MICGNINQTVNKILKIKKFRKPYDFQRKNYLIFSWFWGIQNFFAFLQFRKNQLRLCFSNRETNYSLILHCLLFILLLLHCLLFIPLLLHTVSFGTLIITISFRLKFFFKVVELFKKNKIFLLKKFNNII